MVGHSYGSGLVRRYGYRFPEEVVGIVLTATSYPDEEVLRNASAADEQDESLFKIYGLCTRTGLLRLMPEGLLPEAARLYFGLLRRYLPPETAECEIAFSYQTRHAQSMVIEREHPTSAEEDEDVAACRRGFGNIPSWCSRSDGFIHLMLTNARGRKPGAKRNGRRNWRDCPHEESTSMSTAAISFRSNGQPSLSMRSAM